VDSGEHQKYVKALEVFSKAQPWPENYLMIAISLTQLGKFTKALHSYRQSVQGFLNDRKAWLGTGQPNWLVYSYILANQADLHPKVCEELEAYKQHPGGDSLVAFYAYGMLHLMSGDDNGASVYVPKLTKNPRHKWIFAAGKTMQAIVEQSQVDLRESLHGLLIAHQRLAKFGSLRETPEGFLCLPAMVLSRVALDRGMEVDLESEYLSRGYLNYLLHEDNS